MRYLLLVLSFVTAVARAVEPTPQEVFEKRLLPIFKSPDPSSCVQCHLGGVELKNYIRPTHEQTFASLRDQGLIDLDAPEKSRILALIKMGETDTGATRIQKATRESELAAFADWIMRSVADPRLRALPRLKPAELAKPSQADAVIRYGRIDRVLESFTNTIWPMRFRCMSCHSEGSEQNRKLLEEYGDRVAWFKVDGPRATLDYLRRSGLMNVDDPEKSLLLRKPLNDIKHGGGLKIVRGDQGYKAIRTFVEEYARIVKREYTTASDLPQRDGGVRRFGTDIWLKLENTPPEWGDKLLQVTLYAHDEAENRWEPIPIATSDRVVWGKGKLWQHNLTLLADEKSPRAMAWTQATPVLPRGRYLIRIHLDKQGTLAHDWRQPMADSHYVGEVAVESAWPVGYGKMTVVSAQNVKSAR